VRLKAMEPVSARNTERLREGERIMLRMESVEGFMSTSESLRVSPRSAPRGEESRVRVRGETAFARRARILVIDDEPLLGRTLSFMLEERHDVVVIGNGREALARLEADAEFDLVLCDLDMPELTGQAVYEAVARLHPELESRFVLMTGGACARWAEDFLAGYRGVQLDKPFSTDDVEQVLDLVG
jgi:CheY-like chemotaxis protein